MEALKRSLRVGFEVLQRLDGTSLDAVETAVRVLEDFHCFYEIVLPDEPLIPGIRFLSELVAEPPEKIESANHSEVRWVSESDFRKLPPDEFVGTLKEEVIQLLERYKKSRK